MKLIFYGGKGGVGKTTCSAAFALAQSAALRRKKTSERVLVVSTDPAHSLGDVLGLRFSSAPRRVRGRLDAVELDARRAFARWLRENRRALGDILEHGTWLDATDVDTLLDLSFPGIDELVGLGAVIPLSTGRYRQVFGTLTPEVSAVREHTDDLYNLAERGTGLVITAHRDAIPERLIFIGVSGD